MTSHHPENFEPAQNHHRPEHQEQHHFHQNHHHLHPHHSEFKHVGHQRQHQSHHDSANMVKDGQLPPMQFTDHHGDAAAAAKPSAANKTDNTKASSHAEAADNGMVKFGNLKGAAVDTDGAGAHRHTEDRTRQSQTSLKRDGHSLDTDKDAFVALPKKTMEQNGIHLGDKGYLVRSDTGAKVPVVFGDVSSGKQWSHGQPEASVAALKGLGFNDVNGARGVGKDVNFQLYMKPGSKNTELNV